MGDSSKLVACPDSGNDMEQSPSAWPIGRREEMEAYRIDRFGSVDGIVLRSSEDPRPGPKEILMRCARARSTTAI